MKCPLCKSTHNKQLYSGSAYPSWSQGKPVSLTIFLCMECGLGWRCDAHSSEDALEVKSRYKSFDKNKLFQFPRRSPENIRTRDMILSGLEEKKNPNILEIGANRGDMLALLKEALPEANLIGCDPAECDIAPMPVVRAPFSADLFSPSFDMVTMQHVLEHIPMGVPFLKEVKNTLKQDGTIYIEVPNLEHSLAHMVDDFTIEHACYYTPYSLTLALKKCGLHVDRFDAQGFLRILTGQKTKTAPGTPDTAQLLKMGTNYSTARQKGIQTILDHAAEGKRVVFYGISFYFHSLITSPG